MFAAENQTQKTDNVWEVKYYQSASLSLCVLAKCDIYMSGEKN